MLISSYPQVRIFLKKNLSVLDRSPGKTDLKEVGRAAHWENFDGTAFLCQPWVTRSGPFLSHSDLFSSPSHPPASTSHTVSHRSRGIHPHLCTHLPRVPSTCRAISPTPPHSHRPVNLRGEQTGSRCAARDPHPTKIQSPAALGPPEDKGPIHTAHGASLCCLNLQSCLGTLPSATGHTACFPVVLPVRPPTSRRGLWSLSELGEEK